MTARPNFRAIKEKIKNWSEIGPLVLAVSGGIDSMWMWDFVAGCDIPYVVAHFKHNIRSDAEQQKDIDVIHNAMVRYRAQSLHTGQGQNIKELAISTGKGVESVAREQRYAFLHDVSARINSPYHSVIITAHHADDQVETVLLNLMRGTDHYSLAMREKNGLVMRPFLSVHKSDIINLAASRHLQWNEDVTNDDLHHDRNWIRNEVLPLLNQRRNVSKSILTGVSKN